MSKTNVYVAYAVGDDRSPHYVPVPPYDAPVFSDPDDWEALFDAPRHEGAVAVKIVEEGRTDERQFMPDGSLPATYMVVNPEYGAPPNYTATLRELQGMFPATEFIETTAILVRDQWRIELRCVAVDVRYLSARVHDDIAPTEQLETVRPVGIFSRRAAFHALQCPCLHCQGEPFHTEPYFFLSFAQRVSAAFLAIVTRSSGVSFAVPCLATRQPSGDSSGVFRGVL